MENNSNKQKKQKSLSRRWFTFAVVTALYLAFLLWVKSWWGLIVVPFIYDVYITKKIRWQWWKDSLNPVVRGVMSWVDAIVFALVAVYFINLFFFQNYVIPSSSLEKSLLTGDYLFVSKMSYGPRIPQTPLTMPLTQHTLPFFNCKSYIEWPHWDYRRVKGFGNVQLNDIVVFNFPAGDTICSAPQYQAHDYYQICYGRGYQLNPYDVNPDSLSAADRMRYFDIIYTLGRDFVSSNTADYGVIDTRPVDRRENYVKRCVGLPGQTLEIRDRIIYLDGKVNKEPDNVQYQYTVTFKQEAHLTDEFLLANGITFEDLGAAYPEQKQLMRRLLDDYGYIPVDKELTMPMTKSTVEAFRGMKDFVESVDVVNKDDSSDIYPLNGNKHWTCDNYGPIWIPQKGKSIRLTLDNIAVYERPIRVYEGNDLEIRDGHIYINGKEAAEYTFRMDYYWMMGDNRHNSADSRYWGFVPEDHIVGKPIFIWWSSDPDRNFFSGIRWNRLFRFVDNIK